MNLMMRFMNALLKTYKIFVGDKQYAHGSAVSGETGYWSWDKRSEFLQDMGFPWLENLLGALESIVGPILIVVGAVGVIYAIYLGVMLAKAENAEKREEAKKRIINVLIAIAITAALIFLMYLFSANVDWFMGLNKENEAVIGLLR